MLFRTLGLAALLGLSVACSRTRAQTPTFTLPPPPPLTADTDLHPWLETVLATGKIPGISVVVLRGDEIVAQGVAGVRKLGSPERITADDRFHLGSNTKAMTATLVAMLVEEGKLSWTTTLGEIFGDTVKDLHPGWREVTLRHVLAHRAGLPANAGFVDRVGAFLDRHPLQEQRAALVAETLHAAPATPPGTKMLYSNVGFIVLGAALEKKTGRAWEDLMRERLFQPLGITSGGFGVPSAKGDVDAPWGHREQRATQFDNAPVIGPAGNVHMMPRDWAKFVALHLRGDPSNPRAAPRLLSAETFRTLHTPGSGENYFAGWVVEPESPAGGEDRALGKVLWHNGSNGSWYAVARFAPERDAAALVACNSFSAEARRAVEQVAKALLLRAANPTPSAAATTPSAPAEASSPRSTAPRP